MGRPTKDWVGLFPPLRQYWQEINREQREAKAAERAAHKVRDKARPKCKCEAYPWPHRPAGGFCRYPDPPIERWQRKPGARPYRERYAGIRRQIARANGMHPIKDADAIQKYMPQAIALAKQTKRRRPRIRYREVEITENGVRVQLPGSHPEWGNDK
jgi:hypothetical protein